MLSQTPRKAATAGCLHVAVDPSVVTPKKSLTASPLAASPRWVLSPFQKLNIRDTEKDDSPATARLQPGTPNTPFKLSATPCRSRRKNADKQLWGSKRKGGAVFGAGVSSVTPTQHSPKGIVKRGSAGKPAGFKIPSPAKNRKKNLHYDRFIPDRSTMCLASAQINIARQEPGNEQYLNKASLAYQERLARACGLALDKRILSFKSEPPRSEQDELRTAFSRPMRPNLAAASLRRRILRTPERVLDAPGMVDDYYLNLLDWSCRNMLAVGLDKSVYLWNADSGDVLPLCTSTSPEPIASLRWAPDGTYLAIGTYEGSTQIWDVETKAKVRSMVSHQARIGVLSWSKNIVSSGCRDGSIHHHDVRDSQHRTLELLNHTGEVCGLAWRSDGHQLASGGNDNLVNIWDARGSLPKYTKSDHTAAVKALAWCPWQANLLASGGGSHDRQIHFWNTTTSARINSVDAGSQVTGLVWSREYREVLSSHGFPDNNLSIWSYPSLVKVADIPAHDARILHTATSPDGQTVATTSSDENLKFWRCFELDPAKAQAAKGMSSFSRSSSGGREGRRERADATAAAKRGSSASTLLR